MDASFPPSPELADPKAREAYGALLEVMDPETGISLVDLGLVYDLAFHADTGLLEVIMTLTSRACPAGGAMVEGVKNRLRQLEGVQDVEVDVVFDPPWSPERITPEGRAILGG